MYKPDTKKEIQTDEHKKKILQNLIAHIIM